MIGETIEWLGAWTWFIAGVLLLILEVLAPGTFFLWFGVAAIVTGIVAMIHDFGWQTELILFAVLAIVFVVVGRRRPGREESALVDPDRSGPTDESDDAASLPS